MKLSIRLLCVALLVAGVSSGWAAENGDGDSPEQTGVTTRTANAKSVIDPIATTVRDVIFRYHREGRALLKEKIKFQRQYPKEFELIDSKNFDRGFSMSVRDPFFVSALSTVAQLVDTGRDVVVGDFGFGAGDTSFLFALVGASVMGIENQISSDEYRRSQELYSYYTTLAKRIGSEDIRSDNSEHKNVCKRMKECGLSLRMKFRTDARLLHEDLEIKSNSYSVLFMGNFLHMFDPATAKELIRKQAHRMLHSGGNVFASVDGVAAQDGSTDAYLQAVTERKKFPSVMTATNYGKLSAKGEIGEIDPTAFFTPAKIDETGRTASECRRINTRKWHYCGPDLKSKLEVTSETPTTETFLCAEVNRTVCLYDSSLIDFVFPDSEWNVSVLRKDIYGQYNPDLLDHEVAKWNIIALKK